ncbi:RNA-guided endonuclease InsQ/TnpB family protein [Lactobacillus kefiranofaciens]|uniref:RNA-guided endonuclease InsQ/TnpB family protein n=1 Tax=Lactobacillus kefiranofaciens TaxID=267818 RepID=UPI00166B7F61|nr:RNA-guided endonuclease TnpB family protein [Lactobacillus kefiranofaciens]MCJ2171598.1 transposase [Lactobacillus kefiranofaciens]QNT44523.1 IS200/IS605 family element transposase accessory protein TnpB [Lactobacillus kefiranofaciens]
MKRMSSLACHFGIKLRFYPSSKQKKIIKLNYDAQRFVYNSYVGRNRTNYHARRFLASRQCQAMPFVFSALNRYETELAETVAANNELLAKPKNIRNAYSFLRVKEIDSLALANTIQNYQKAWNNYRKIGHGIPTFHKKRSDWSYQTNCQYPKQLEAYLDNGTAKFIDDKHVKLPKLGVVRIAGFRKLIEARLLNHIPTRIGTVTIKKIADNQFYLSMQLGSDVSFVKDLPKTQSQIGIDLNLDNFLTESNGAMVANPRFYRKAKKKLAHAQRVLSRRQRRAKQEGRNLRTASNYQKQRLAVAKLHDKIRRQRADFLQTLSTALIKNHDLVVAEELRSKNLLKNHALSQAISDVGWRSFLNMLAYKAQLYGKEFLTIDPKYTTQRCHACGSIMGQNGYRKLTLRDREWACPMCHTHHIRDWNAAINILEKGQKLWQNPKTKEKAA